MEQQEQMLKHTLVIGLNDKDTKTQIIPTEQAIQIVAGIIGDCTIKQDSTGFYTHEDGTKVVEKSLTVEQFSTKAFNVTLAKKIKKALNQESVILDTEPSTAQFI